MMVDLDETPEPVHRCPRCDSVVAADAKLCLMCGKELAAVVAAPTVPVVQTQVQEQVQEAEEQTAVPLSLSPIAEPIETAVPQTEFVAIMRERQSRSVFLLTAVFFLIIIVIGSLILRFQEPITSFAYIPTPSPVPPTATSTATSTATPTATAQASETPTHTLTPSPTETPAPERLHILVSGQTLIGLSLIYNVSPDSIAQANGFVVEQSVQAGQSLIIPWPTPTPPLVAVAIEINGESVVADPNECPRHQIQSGESMASIANQYGLNLALLLQVNRLAADAIVQPGQTVCIPEIKVGAELPPTPGPSPTPAPTQFPAGPLLLYPADGWLVVDADGRVMLQWTAVKDLDADEWYMIEVADLDVLDVPPYRGFTRDNGYHLPAEWRPAVLADHTFQWRVSIVQVTSWRADGLPIYQYGGRFSQPATFIWPGAIPTATPTPTATPLPSPTPTS